MGDESTLARAYSVATLEQTRAQLRTWWGVAMVASIGIVFGLISLLVGQMLILEPIGGTYGYEVVYGGGATAWWNYPGLIVVEPWGLLALPFLPTLAMVLVSYGVGLGMSIAILIGARMVRLRRRPLGQPTAVGGVTGLTPAMIALVTLGACCSTTAAATAGIGVAAQTSGSTVDALLQNNWYLNVFQLVILWVALIAQEQLLVAYGIFFEPSKGATGKQPARDRFALVRGLARVALLVGGVTWSLATLAAWTTTDPTTAGAGQWFHWIVQQQLPALVAVSVALAPGGALHFARRHVHTAGGAALRVMLLISGASLLLWFPAPVVSAGVVGWLNEVAGAAGVSAGAGGFLPPEIFGWGLAFHWVFQLLALGALSVGIAWRPLSVLRLFAPTEIVPSLDSPTTAPGTPSERPSIAASSGSTSDP